MVGAKASGRPDAGGTMPRADPVLRWGPEQTGRRVPRSASGSRSVGRRRWRSRFCGRRGAAHRPRGSSSLYESTADGQVGHAREHGALARLWPGILGGGDRARAPVTVRDGEAVPGERTATQGRGRRRGDGAIDRSSPPSARTATDRHAVPSRRPATPDASPRRGSGGRKSGTGRPRPSRAGPRSFPVSPTGVARRELGRSRSRQSVSRLTPPAPREHRQAPSEIRGTVEAGLRSTATMSGRRADPSCPSTSTMPRRG